MRSPLAGAALALALLVPASAEAQQATASPNLKHVFNAQYEARHGSVKNYGTDIEFARLQGKQHALAGSYRNGLQIFDISKPEAPKLAGVYDCGITQGDVQVFQRANRTYATYTADATPGASARENSDCFNEARELGFNTTTTSGRGTFIADVTNPAKPETVSYVAVPLGSHNQTVHPSGDFLYNSNSELITNVANSAIEVYDIRDFAKPKLAATFPLLKFPGLGNDSHDITFSADGKRAYSAALSHEEIINTEDPAKPTRVSVITDPTINVWHQSDPIEIAGRKILVVEDEFAGATPTDQCPNGGVHFFDITVEAAPVKVGYWNIDQVRTAPGYSCTAHVFRLHDKEDLMTISFYNGGVSVVDLKGVVGAGIGGTSVTGAKQIAFSRFANSNSWSAKTPEIEEDGDFFLFSNDITRGLDVFEYDAQAPKTTATGRWLTAGESLVSLPRRSAGELSTYEMLCLLNQQS